MVSPPTIRLFDAEPDLIGFLAPHETARARETELPVVSVPRGELDMRTLLLERGAFGAIIVDGMLMQSLRLGTHASLRLLGPGDVVALSQAPRSVLVVAATCRASVPTRLALLARDTLVAIRRWPQIAAGLHARAGEQSERLVTQMMISQLPRVESRLLALLWLLAESWGQVTPAGTLVPFALTHAELGGLVGARRPTVTLALGHLTAADMLRRDERGWLLRVTPDELVVQQLGRTNDRPVHESTS